MPTDFPKTHTNDRLLRAARGEEVDRPPVWLMRQAGRILPEYRAIRNRLSGFKELVSTPELAAEVTVQPVDLLGVDAAIIFSDILVVPEALGLDYEMVEKKGPNFPETIRSRREAERLSEEALEERLQYVPAAIRKTKEALAGRVPLIGFAGAPWTLFCYMVEGEGSKVFSHPRRMLYQDPELAHDILQKITNATITYLQMQIQAGADLVQVFDSWAGILNKPLYSAFALPYLHQIAEAIDQVPLTVFSKGAAFSLEELCHLNCQTIGLDWAMAPETARHYCQQQKTLQGNLDPAALYGSEHIIAIETEKMLRSFGKQRYIANLGHGVYPDTDPGKVKFFIDYIKDFRF